MTTDAPDSRELFAKAERLIDELQETKGEVVGEKQLAKERADRKVQVYATAALMAIITIVSVLATVALLRQPGPAGPTGPTPFFAQFVRDEAGCLYRVLYKSHDGLVVTVDARAPAESCNG